MGSYRRVKMLSCTFFGHRDCPEAIEKELEKEIKKLIMQGRADNFFVGNNGRFDMCCRRVLRRMKDEYPNINYSVVLSYLPKRAEDFEDYSDTILPETVNNGHPRFAIERRNKWMIENSQIAVCYVEHSYGGAYKFARLAAARKLEIINLGRLDINKR